MLQTTVLITKLYNSLGQTKTCLLPIWPKEFIVFYAVLFDFLVYRLSFLHSFSFRWAPEMQPKFNPVQ